MRKSKQIDILYHRLNETDSRLKNIENKFIESMNSFSDEIRRLKIFEDSVENPPKFKLGDRVLIKRAYDRTIYTIIQVDHNYLSLEERRLSEDYSHWIYIIMNEEYYRIKERETDIRLYREEDDRI